MDSRKRPSPPDLPRRFPGARGWNIGFRTAHIGVTGILFGGHVFEIAREQLHLWLILSTLSGIGLVALEAGPRLRWFHQGRGLFVLAKLAILCAVPLLWEIRVYLFSAVVVLASVGSHMPGRFRYYSVLYRRVLDN
jgi:hypothetical protein